MKEKIYQKSPNPVQNLMIAVFNMLAYRERYKGNYQRYLNLYNKNNELALEQLLIIQERKFIRLVNFAYKNSEFYQDLYRDVELPKTLSDINKLPIVDKEMLRANLKKIYTLEKHKGVVSKTGGTTGKSLEVVYTKDNLQERFAMLDNFRGQSGYQLGKRTAWFSGKNILTARDVKKNRFWKTDYLYKVRYYSTFHVKEEYLVHYILDLIKFKPEYIVGFPSTILEIAKLGIKKKIEFPTDTVKAVFPTAESVTEDMRKQIEKFFKSKIYDQYASSEGAPFIFECKNGNLHLELQSGVFEVLDENNQPVRQGRLVVTSFTTEGTPLIRYDIGDQIELSDEICTCGNQNPLVARIFGRVDDYLVSPTNGKINLGNISNTLKDVKGVIKFQAIQNNLQEIEVLTIIDNNIYNKNSEIAFRQSWVDRMGSDIDIKINYVDDIPSEKSGKYRIIKNNLSKS